MWQKGAGRTHWMDSSFETARAHFLSLRRALSFASRPDAPCAVGFALLPLLLFDCSTLNYSCHGNEVF
jgi:hypothetical protein